MTAAEGQMKLYLEWAQQITLQHNPSDKLIYGCELNKIPEKPGIYIFWRCFGDTFEALYVWQALDVRERVKQHFTNNVPVMKHLENAKHGSRVVSVGRFLPKPGQNTKSCLRIIERALIRHFLLDGHDLVNVKGTSLTQHEITCAGQDRPIPKTMFVDKIGKKIPN
jgi:hypothetical protein